MDTSSSKKSVESRNRKASVGYIALLIVGVALVCVAVALFASGEIEDLRAQRASDSILMQLDEVRPEVREVPVSYLVGAGDGAMPVEWVDQYDYVGSIVIPSLGIDLPVSAETDDNRLRDSPCRYGGSYLNDDFVICGEGYGSHFGSLGSVGIGDEVYFVAVDGTLHRYVVGNVETDDLEDINAVEDDWDLTLFTFTDDDACLVVRCVRAKS